MKPNGFSLLEVLLAVTILGLLAVGFISALLYGQENAHLTVNRQIAASLAEEGMEAVRNIRDASFSNLAAGTYGLSTANNQWNLTGSSDLTGIFTRTVTLAAIDSKRMQVTTTVNWQQNLQRPGTITIVGYLTNWKTAIASIDLLITTVAAALSNGNRTLSGITLRNAGTNTITIDSITPTWTGGANTNWLESITIGGASVFSGTANSGTAIDITNLTLAPSPVTTTPINSLVFNKSINNATLILLFTMTDGSTRSATLNL